MKSDFLIDERIIFYSFIFFFLTVLVLVRLFLINRSSSLSSYLMSKKKISWHAVLKYWVYLQIGGIFLMKGVDCVLFPILLIYFLIVHGLCTAPEVKPNSKEYNDYEKSFNRDKKINKLLK